MAGPAAAPALGSERLRQRQLAITKRRATLLLGLVSIIFVGVSVAGTKSTWAGYLQATAEASMVGGLADWFAVTALFRRPLGLPIPHTAIIVERKNQFAVTLAQFIRESFLTPDAVAERLRAADIPGRMSHWLSDPVNATRLSAEIASAAVALADLLREEDVHSAMEQMIRQRLAAIDVAAIAGRALQFATDDGRYAEVLNAAFVGLGRYLDQHRDELRSRLDEASPWWLPGAVEDRIFGRLIDGARAVLAEMAAQPTHPLRKDLEARIAQVASDLQTSDLWRARGEQLKRDVLSQPQVGAWVATLWIQIKQELRSQAADDDSDLRRRLTQAIAATGSRVEHDPTLSHRLEDGVVSGASYIIEHFDGEIASLISGTIGRWDAGETARRLELLLGPDLQYIRINGTVVGAAAGLVLHTIARALS